MATIPDPADSDLSGAPGRTGRTSRGWFGSPARVWLALAGWLAAAAALADGATFEFERLNRTYESFVEELAPVAVGPALVKLSSPEHSLTLIRHAARLERLAGGGYALELEIRLTGRGVLDADISWGRLQSQLSDQLAVPVQTLLLRGQVLIQTGADGYLIETKSSDPEVVVRIESQLGGRLARLCHQMALVLVNMDCLALEESVTRIRVPLPPPGQTFVLPFAELTEKERAALDAFLEASG